MVSLTKKYSKGIKPIPPSEIHPKGGLKVIWTVWGAPGKREKSLWYEDYNSTKELERQAEIVRNKFDEELREIKETLRDPLRSLKQRQSLSTLKDIAEKRIKIHGDASMGDYFDRLIGICGNKTPAEWRDTYFETIKYLEQSVSIRTKKPLSDSTINRYKSTFRMIFKFALDERIISEMPVKVEIEEEDGRDRVWSKEEKTKIFSTMKKRSSWLYMPIYFSSLNPIRVSDLFGNHNKDTLGLRVSNWDPDKNWVSFYASKTRRIKKRLTYLKQIDGSIRDYFNSLPQDCPFLFPRIFPDGSWKQVAVNNSHREYEAEFEAILKDAKISNFRWHDLKHCAITFLLDNGYSDLDLKNCGIQYCKQMIDRYYHHDAEKAPVLSGFEKPTLELVKTA
jgi:integrase